jgi:hypothetical protein
MRPGPPAQLFSGSPLSETLSAAARHAAEMLARWQSDDLLSAAEADVTEQLVRLATFEMPSLSRGEAFLEPPEEVTLQARDYDGSFQVTVTRFTLVVPITGEPKLFALTASRFSPSPLLGEIDESSRTLRLHCDNLDDAGQIKTYFERLLNHIEERLGWTRAELYAHNQLMATQIPAAVTQRRAKLLNDRNLHASIGYPIKKRPDASSYSVPVTRKKVTPAQRPRSSARPNPYVPEPALADADYEAALAVLRNARNALERSPTMSAKLDEQEVRDLLLVSLNAQFEGRAAGEVFNCTGKTDILIREGDRNVFVGECKIFDPKYKQSVDRIVTDALDQLLSYLVWRDTKAALLLFIRDAHVSAIVDKALATTRSHPNYKRPGKISVEERHDFVLHANGDTSREIYLAFLPFLIGSRKT